MRWKQADFLAGSFVIAGTALIIAIFVIVRGSVGAPDRYHAHFDNVAGLRAGATVVYEGYIIGAVEDVEPIASNEGMKFRIDLAVEKGWKIPEDSVAEISAVSLLSANAIQITAGIGNPLPVDSEIRSMKSANIMADISKTADELSAIAQSHLAPLLSTLRDVLDTEGRGALASVGTLSNELATRTPAIMSNIENVTENVAGLVVKTEAAATKAFTVASTQNINRVGSILSRVDASAAQLESALASVGRSTGQVETIVGPENVARLSNILANLEQLQGDLDQIAKTTITTSRNIEQVSEFSEDRLEGFLLRMESAALNIEEMTARLRDDPSILILGTE